MKTKLVFLFLTVFAVTTVFAQRMTSFTWESYKMKFDIPTTFEVKDNTGEKFMASNTDINLTIYPRKGENLDADGMISALDGWAKDSQLGNLTEMEVISSQLNGYWGVFQEGTKNNWPVFLMLIVDPDYPDISFYVWISYATGTEDTALKILKSFTPI